MDFQAIKTKLMKTRLFIVAGLMAGLMANSQTLSVPGTTFGTLVPITVTYAGASGIGGSWIGLYRAGAGDGDYITYQYINEAVNGSIVFPGWEDTGLFTFRLFRGGGYDKIATSSVFMVRQGMLPDVSFHNSGVFRREALGGFPEIWATAVRIMPDDRIVVAGNIRTGQNDASGYAKNGFLAARFLANGNPDPAFGDNGFAWYLFPDLYYSAFYVSAKEARAMAVQEDGKVVIGGIAMVYGTGFYIQAVILVRFNANGTIDNSFGSKGVVIDNYKWPAEGPTFAWDDLRCVEIDNQGRILCGGGSLLDRPYSPGRPFIGRYLPDGTPDLPFGNVGMITPTDSIAFRGYVESIVPPAAGGDGSILAGVTQVSQFGQNYMLLYKVRDNGQFVEDFGHKGIVVDHRPGLVNDQYVKSIGITPAGSLIMMGGNSYWSMWIASKSPIDGSDHSSFGTGGVATNDPTYSIDVTAGMVLPPDNSIVVGTSTMSYRWSVCRFGPNGNLRPDFGTSFYPVTDNGSTVESFVAGIGMQKDGKYILVGGSRFAATNTWDFMVLRFVDNPANFSGIDDKSAVNSILSQNYPNPFQNMTTFSWSQPADSHVTLVVYDVTGNRVAEVINSDRPAGIHSLGWGPGTGSGGTLAPGSYFYRITVQPIGGQAPFVATRKMLVLPEGR